MTKGEVGVWNGSKKDDVIYEQPLSLSDIPWLAIWLSQPFTIEF